MAAKFKLVMKGARNISAFRNLVYAVKKMQLMNQIYDAYPKTPEEFLKWRPQVTQEIEEAKKRFPVT
jgi:hypothetical protein